MQSIAKLFAARPVLTVGLVLGSITVLALIFGSDATLGMLSAVWAEITGG